MSATNSTELVSVAEAAFWCSLFVIEALVIVVGNLLTTAVFLWSSKLRKRRHYLLINLAISDTLVGAWAMPLFIVLFGINFKLWSSFGAIPASLYVFVDMFSGFASITFLATISLERLYATLRPFSYRALKSRWYVLHIAVAWVGAALVPAVHLVAITFQEVFLPSRDSMVVALWVPFLSALLLIICTSYAVIWRRVRTVNRRTGTKAAEKESSLSRICWLVTVISLLAWLPFVVVNMAYAFTPSSYNFHLFYVTKLLHYANSLLNPVLYVLKIPGFKAALSSMFKKKTLRTVQFSRR